MHCPALPRKTFEARTTRSGQRVDPRCAPPGPSPYPAGVDLQRLTARLSRLRPTPSTARARDGRRARSRGALGSRESISRSAPTTDYALAGEPLPDLEYAPRRNGEPDPGEVVWAWVPYEDDAREGKDRPVLIVARAHGRLVGLMLSSKDHDGDAADEARYGRFWMDVGTGGWDRQRRASEARLDRVLSLPVDGVRREGAALPAPVFARVVAGLRAVHGE